MRCVPAVLIGAALLSAPPRLPARDRPGTPNDVRAGMWEAPVARLPRVLVTFRNTASEPVSFWIEWTENGAPMPSDLTGRAECAGGSAQLYDCSALDSFRPLFKWRLITKREHPQGIIFNDLAFDSRYCFRFIARDEDGVISDIWSAWACVQTPPPPPVPAAPTRAQVTFLTGASGRGEVGSSAPPRVLLEWDAYDKGGVAWFAVESWRASDGRWYRLESTPGEERRVRPDAAVREFETTLDVSSKVDPKAPPRFRVCSVNISGSACTVAQPGLLLQTAVPAAPAAGARAAAEPAAPSPATPVDPAAPVELNPQPLPPKGAGVLERRKPGEVKAPDRLLTSGTARDTPLQQSPLAGGVIGPGSRAGELRGGDRIVCRGGETVAIACCGSAADGTPLHLMYFLPAKQAAHADGRGLEPGRCAFIDRAELSDGNAGIIYFKAAPDGEEGSAQGLRTYLSEANHYWSFLVHKDAVGYYEASRHARWTPSASP